MRGLVLLCLFGTVLSNGQYQWAPEEDSGNNDPNADNPCLTDTSSCGCCLMQKKLHQIEQLFNMTMAEFEKGLVKAQTALNKVRTSRSAFSVALTKESYCYGPFLEPMNVLYQVIFLNLGGGYDSTTGVFTVDAIGRVQPGAHRVQRLWRARVRSYACALLQVNGEILASANDHNAQDQEDSASIAVAVQLSTGDQVSVLMPAHCYLCGDWNHYNTFTGILLYPTD
ncbi:hypothetical protein AAFF_G00346140 [Aldrovandia affinis]|uniref:C1q domain-containing protein n=1 Tax=Aldrovandia affinis TaxID=143900 RepID=A0AAD7SLP7_9TELE|nr:hypothetical protein AAFF_G00346140 [Aldrovandia affinis]